MKTEIGKNGVLYIKAQNNTEAYALDNWQQNNICDCTGELNHPEMHLLQIDSNLPKITLFKRIKLKIQLFFYR